MIYRHVFTIDRNISSEFLEELEEEMEELPCLPVFHKWLPALLICFMVCGILFNGFILLTFIQLPRIRSFTNYFVASLALADILMVILNPILFLLLLYRKVEFDIGDILRFNFEIFCSMASLISFACISVDRMLAIAKPLYHRTLPRSRCIRGVVLIWIFSVIATILDFILSAKDVVDDFIITCCNFCFAFAIPTLITIVSYVIIARVIIRRRRKTFQETDNCGSTRMKHTIRITWKILLVILPGIILWLFYWVSAFIDLKNEEDDKFSLSFVEIRSLVPIFAAVVNALIFIPLTPEFRNRLLKFVCRRSRTDLGRITQKT